MQILDLQSRYNSKQRFDMPSKREPEKPVENHKTAAWNNVKSKDSISKISRPNLSGTIDAKEYVDENEK